MSVLSALMMGGSGGKDPGQGDGPDGERVILAFVSGEMSECVFVYRTSNGHVNLEQNISAISPPVYNSHSITYDAVDLSPDGKIITKMASESPYGPEQFYFRSGSWERVTRADGDKTPSKDFRTVYASEDGSCIVGVLLKSTASSSTRKDGLSIFTSDGNIIVPQELNSIGSDIDDSTASRDLRFLFNTPTTFCSIIDNSLQLIYYVEPPAVATVERLSSSHDARWIAGTGYVGIKTTERTRGNLAIWLRDDETTTLRLMNTERFSTEGYMFGERRTSAYAQNYAFNMSHDGRWVVGASRDRPFNLLFVKIDTSITDPDADIIETIFEVSPSEINTSEMGWVHFAKFSDDGKYLFVSYEKSGDTGTRCFEFDADSNNPIGRMVDIGPLTNKRVYSLHVTGDLSEGDDPDPVPDDDPYYVLATYTRTPERGLEIRKVNKDFNEFTLEQSFSLQGNPSGGSRELLQISPYAKYITFNHYMIEGTTTPTALKWNQDDGIYEPMPSNNDDPAFINNYAYVSNSGLVVGHKNTGSGPSKLKIFKDIDGTLEPTDSFLNSADKVFTSPDCRSVLINRYGDINLHKIDADGTFTDILPVDVPPAMAFNEAAVAHDASWVVMARPVQGVTEISIYRRDDALGQLVKLDTSSFPLFNTEPMGSGQNPWLFFTAHPEKNMFVVGEVAMETLHFFEIDPDASGDILLNHATLTLPRIPVEDYSKDAWINQALFTPDGKYLLVTFRQGNVKPFYGGMRVFEFDADNPADPIGEEKQLPPELSLSEENSTMEVSAVGMRGVDLDISH